jgi:DNA-binding protein YbaB
MRERMGEMQGRMNEMLQEVLRRMESEFKERTQTQPHGEGLVPVGRKGIVRHVPIEEG